MKPQHGLVLVIVAAVLALLVAAGAAIVLGRKGQWLASKLGGQQEPSRPRNRNLRAERVDIGSGEIAVVDFLRVIGDCSGLPVIHDGTDPRITQAKLMVTAPMRNVDFELLLSFLEIRGYSVEQETLDNGRRIIRVAAKEVARP